jgi:hypothetical protein
MLLLTNNEMNIKMRLKQLLKYEIVVAVETQINILL